MSFSASSANLLVVEKRHGEKRKGRGDCSPQGNQKRSVPLSELSFCQTRGIAFRAVLVALHFDRASKAWSPVGSALVINPHGHVKTVIAPFVGAGLLQGIEQVAVRSRAAVIGGLLAMVFLLGSDGGALLGLLRIAQSQSASSFGAVGRHVS
jgi:hypothetical protein